MGFLEDLDKDRVFFLLYELITPQIEQRRVLERLSYLASHTSHLIYNFFIEGRGQSDSCPPPLRVQDPISSTKTSPALLPLPFWDLQVHK